MTLHDKILQIYPELASYDFCIGDIILENNCDGNGDYISRWEHPTLPRPTQEQLDGISS